MTRLLTLTCLTMLPTLALAQTADDTDGAAEAALPQQTPVRPVVAYEVIRPCIPSGYVAYQLPAVNSCKCGDDGCFHPCRYYCCRSDAYKKGWLRKWVGTQFGKRSMLDDYPCQCICPTSVPRPYLKTANVNHQATVEVAPVPAAEE